MTREEYLQKKTSSITPSQSAAIRVRLTENHSCDQIAKEIGCVPIQVAAVKANVAEKATSKKAEEADGETEGEDHATKIARFHTLLKQLEQAKTVQERERFV